MRHDYPNFRISIVSKFAPFLSLSPQFPPVKAPIERVSAKNKLAIG